MKVLILSDADMGGAESVAAAQAGELRKQGLDTLLLVGSELKKFSARFRNWRTVWNPAGIRLLKKSIKQFKPDVIHIHNVGWKYSYACLKVAKLSGAKVFFTAHDTGLFYPEKFFGRADFWYQLRRHKFRFNPFRNYFIKKYVKYVDRIFAVSDALGSALRLHGFENTTLHNGVDVSEWIRPDRGEHVPTVLLAGRISGPKGASVLPEIKRQVLLGAPGSKFVIVGKDVWVPREKMPEIYAGADVVIVPSVYLDPFPTVVLEAGAAGKPVVVTNQGGAKEAVVEGVTGFVADPYSRMFADRIIELLQNPAKAKEMGERARTHVTQNFSLEKQVKTLIKYYNGSR